MRPLKRSSLASASSRSASEHARAARAGHELGELAREAGLLGVVEEVLLDLVEHE